jgi:antitoxin (DNA-binding transcriptional repressor) of toxin-antitoxin stability system
METKDGPKVFKAHIAMIAPHRRPWSDWMALRRDREFASTLALYDQLWSYLVMRQVGIAELKSRLSEFLRAVQGGESIAVLDRNRAVAHIVPIPERPGLRIRHPAADSPKPNKVSLPKMAAQSIDVVEMLLEERQSHR